MILCDKVILSSAFSQRLDGFSDYVFVFDKEVSWLCEVIGDFAECLDIQHRTAILTSEPTDHWYA